MTVSGIIRRQSKETLRKSNFWSGMVVVGIPVSWYPLQRGMMVMGRIASILPTRPNKSAITANSLQHKRGWKSRRFLFEFSGRNNRAWPRWVYFDFNTPVHSNGFGFLLFSSLFFLFGVVYLCCLWVKRLEESFVWRIKEEFLKASRSFNLFIWCCMRVFYSWFVSLYFEDRVFCKKPWVPSNRLYKRKLKRVKARSFVIRVQRVAKTCRSILTFSSL